MSFKAFAKKKFKAYMIPYFKVAIICFLTLGIAKSLIKYGINDAFSDQIMKYLFGITVFSRGTVEWLPQCSPIWFLSCLFCAEIIFYLIMKTKDYVLPLILFAGLLGYWCSIIGKYFPWNIDNALSAIPLLYIGLLVKKYQRIMLSYWLMPIFLTLTAFAFFQPIIVDFDGNHFSDQFLMYCYGTVITVSIFQIVRRLPIRGGYLQIIGKQTIILFGYNYAINMFVNATHITENPWINGIIEIAIGIVLVMITERYQILKKIIV